MEVIVHPLFTISLWSKLHQKEERVRDADMCSACMSYGDNFSVAAPYSPTRACMQNDIMMVAFRSV